MCRVSFARQRPALAGGEPPTTIGAEELNYRVRDGNGCGLFAIAARHFEVHSLKTRYMRSKQKNRFYIISLQA